MMFRQYAGLLDRLQDVQHPQKHTAVFVYHKMATHLGNVQAAVQNQLMADGDWVLKAVPAAQLCFGSSNRQQLQLQKVSTAAAGYSGAFCYWCHLGRAIAV